MTRRSLLATTVILASLGVTSLAGAPAGAAPAADRSAHAVTQVDYPGTGIEISRTSGDQRTLKGTTRSFKRFVKARLDVLFEQAGSKPRCAASPTVIVDRYDSRGWAKVGEGWYNPCPGGGYAAIYEKTSSGWRQILGAQDVRFCQDLAWYAVPGFIADAKCITEDLSIVRYRAHRDVRVSPEATARRAISLTSGMPIVPQQHVIAPAALEQQQRIADKAYLTVEDCTAEGCEVTAIHKDDTSDSFFYRMQGEGDELLVTEIVAIA